MTKKEYEEFIIRSFMTHVTSQHNVTTYEETIISVNLKGGYARIRCYCVPLDFDERPYWTTFCFSAEGYTNDVPRAREYKVEERYVSEARKLFEEGFQEYLKFCEEEEKKATAV